MMETQSEILKLIGVEDESQLDRSLLEYLNKLCSIGIHGLEKEPNKLIEDQVKLEESIRHEAARNFQCFVETAQFSQNFAEESKEIESNVKTFTEEIPGLRSKLDNFISEANDITKRWRTASLMLSKHNQLLEFLEIPQMVETCIRNEHYEEALRLLAHVDKMSRKDIPLVQSVSEELQKCKETMISQLFKELHGNLELPGTLRTIGYLRTLNALPETELRIKFLMARDIWLKKLTSEVPTSNTLNYMIKLIEIYRVNLFDIVTQYRSVFANQSATTTSVKGSKHESSQDEDRDFGDGTILSSWLSYKLNDFLFRLEETLEKYLMTDISAIYPLENIFEPCFYFGLSMSRIGADFRPLLASIMERITLVHFSQSIDKALTRFEAKMGDYSPPTRLSNTPTPENVSEVAELSPPMELLQFTPLAHLCNDLLSALNKLSKMVPLALIIKFRDILNSRLRQASDIITDLCRNESQDGDDSKFRDAKRLAQAYFYLLVPHIQKCLALLSPLPQMTKMLGLSVIEYNRLKKNSKELAIHDLDMDKIGEPIFDYVDSPT
ncbi:conserved oligomeric Golgi complex subunit 8 isoform X2 [Brevipalpus obovatus]|uniref:conserved oligomeric Golgi complex subunit 8 isoform X2 n=1 Tax=Brevipalpus obovatus TaxID=246614 RepID=UPI003D9EB287